MAFHSSLPAEFGLSVVKVAPGALVTAWAMAARGLPVFVALATLVYLTLQIGHLIWTWRREAAERKAKIAHWEDRAEDDA